MDWAWIDFIMTPRMYPYEGLDKERNCGAPLGRGCQKDR